VTSARQDSGVSLDEDWLRAVRDAEATAGDDAVAGAGADLLARWRQPHRRYHDTEHLAEVLAAVDRLAAEARDVAAVRLAVWFYDAVYDGAPGVDEEASAVLAERVLAGLQRARAQGKRLGRPRLSPSPVGVYGTVREAAKGWG